MENVQQTIPAEILTPEKALDFIIDVFNACDALEVLADSEPIAETKADGVIKFISASLIRLCQEYEQLNENWQAVIDANKETAYC